MVKIKFQDGTYLGFEGNKAIKTVREKAHIYTCVKGAKTAIKYIFMDRVLKGYNTPSYVDLYDVAHPEWNNTVS